ncbi:MAG TPA: DNRLRE domain-containing protein [Gaiellaceae bacterium]|nr:DNRLRE domain-containing protein [Gaiellaceae bacterium]
MRRFRLTPLRLAAAIVLGSLSFAGVGYAASLGLGTKKIFAWSQTLTKGSCNQTSTTADDTFVQQANPTSTTGSSATTLTITGGAMNQNIAFIRFNLSGCSLPTTAGADGSTLALFVTTSSMHTISLFPVTSSWSSSTLNWNGVSGLTIGSTATTTFTGSAGSHTVTVTSDVDAAIKAGTLWGWELKDAAGGPAATTAIASAENGTTANRPSLTLSYEK